MSPRPPTSRRGARRRPAALAVAALAAAGLLAAACSRTVAPAVPREVVAARWAPVDARERFDPDRLLGPASAGGDEAPARCRVRPDPSRPELDEVVCDARRPLPAGPFRLLLEVEGANLSRLRLFAADGPEPVAVAAAAGSPGASARYRFDLPATVVPASEWTFRPVGAAAGRLSGPRLRIVPLVRQDALAAAAVARPWKFAFGDSWRTGALALPGHPVVWKAGSLPAGGRLETAIHAAGAALDWRVVARDAAGSRVLASGTTGAATPDAAAPAAAAPGGVWRALSVALPAGGHGAAELELEVTSGEPGAWGAWSEPLLLAPATSPPPPDVILIVLDTVRADRLTPYGAPAERTPFLARVARERTALFEHAVTPATWTFPAHVSLLTGLEAFRHGAYSETDADVLPALPSLAVELRRRGYRTLAVTADGFVHPALGFATGFDRYSAFEYRRDAEHELARDVDRALSEVGELRGQPLFLFFHTYEAHVPNRARGAAAGDAGELEVLGHQGNPGPETGFYGDPGYLIRDLRTNGTRPATSGDEATITSFYDQALHHIDGELARLAAGLETAGRWRDSMLILTSDHGESLGEHGRMSHTWLDEANLRVPLLVGWPDHWGSGRRVPDLVSLVDVFPTVLAAVGVAPPADLDGVALRARLERGEAPRDHAWSYVAANNHGLAWIAPDARKLLLLDSAWRGAPFRVRAVDPRSDPAETGSAPEAGSRAERAARSLLSRTLTGERVVVIDGTGAALRLRLRHPALGPSTVKSPAGGAELTWSRPGRAETRLPPGGSGEWFLLGAPPGRVDLEGEVRLDDGGGRWLPVRIHAAAPRPDQPVELALDPRTGSWTQGAAAPGRIGFRLSWRGDAAAASRGEEESEELRRGLAALGYLE
jgi:arylsulfatase A-like enzyme